MIRENKGDLVHRGTDRWPMTGRSGRKAQTEGSTMEKWIGSEEKCTKNMEKVYKEIGELRKQMELMYIKWTDVYKNAR